MPDSDDSATYLSTLLEVGRALGSSLDLSEVLHTAIEQVVRFVHAERGFVLILEEETGRVLGKATHDIDPVALELTLTGKSPANAAQVSRTIVERTLKQQQPVVSVDALEDPRFASHTSVKLAQLRSVLCVPLIARGRTLGVVYLDNRVKTAVFEDRHVEMLTAFANQAAVAIENARLYENLRRSMEERIRLQQRLHKEETQRLALEEANRLKSDFIGYVSHELRNPLTAIRGFVQSLAIDAKLDEATRGEFYAIIEAEANRMLFLINDLLDSSRMEAGRPLTLNARPVSVPAILRTVARLTRYSKFWTPQHRITIEVPEDLPDIEADEDKLHQILGNLVSNAVKYSPQGGDIGLHAGEANGGVHIAVSDHGIGMSEEQRARLFRPFERADRREIERIPGTGLGLYLTRHLVELHGGTVDCASEPGLGSTFSVYLPCRPPLRAGTESGIAAADVPA